MSEAGRKLGMSYRAWLLVDDMNNRFRDPVTAAQPSGAHDVARHSPRLGKN
jgi:molybdenum-dependent DNA-binding transcriptional regulator ModE